MRPEAGRPAPPPRLDTALVWQLLLFTTFFPSDLFHDHGVGGLGAGVRNVARAGDGGPRLGPSSHLVRTRLFFEGDAPSRKRSWLSSPSPPARLPGSSQDCRRPEG